MKRKILLFILAMTMVIPLSACEDKQSFSASKEWSGEDIVHDNFIDLGNYVIELPDYNDKSLLEQGLALANERYDNGDISNINCSAMVTTNDKGEVIIGRNQDVEVSQYPAFVYKTTFGKYETYSVTYTASSIGTYEEIQQMSSLPDSYIALIPYIATDVFNEEGLYIETNMRSNYPNLSNYGLHSTHGEIARDDGTLWSDLRACTMTLPQLVGQNCGSVDEAIEFIKNSYDWYTLSLPNDPDLDGWNMAFIIGDASGKYGLIEIAQDSVSWIPYQNGQANYYITPKWNVFDTMGSGYGRLAGIYNVIEGVQTLDDAMEAMESIMWRNEMLWIGETYRADSSTNPNPYNQIIFQDDKGNPQLDWRSDYCGEWSVLDDGRLIISSYVYENAKLATYDEDIIKYIEDAILAGTLVVDDGSILFDVNNEKLTIDELYEKYVLYYELSDDLEEQEKMIPYFEAYNHLLNNQTTYWCEDDHNFEALKAVVYEAIHVRYDEEGNYDNNGMSIYEKLKAYYGYGVEKNETYLRDEGVIWTTGLNIGVNCAQKQMKVRFWENDEVIYSISW